MPEKAISSEFSDELRIEGVYAKGFGIIPKLVMLDPELKIRAKSVYTYFCSYAGSGTDAFPCRDKILHDLNLGKDAFYNALNALIEFGYIEVKQTAMGGYGRGFTKNTYTLIQNPKRLQEQAFKCHGEAVSASHIRYSSIKEAGFGTIGKAVMLDRDLSAESKAIYAYFCALAGNGCVAFPELQSILYHLGISKNTYYKHFNELIEQDYIYIVQTRCGEGQFGVNDYIINEMPDKVQGKQREHRVLAGQPFPKISDKKDEGRGKNPPFPKKSDTQNLAKIEGFAVSDEKNCDRNPPFPKISDTQNLGNGTPMPKTPKTPFPKKPYTQNPNTQNSDTKINRTNMNSSYNYQSIIPGWSERLSDVEKKTLLDDYIVDTILSAGKIPVSLLTDDELLVRTVQVISEWDVFSQPTAWGLRQNADRSHAVYKVYVSALTELLTPHIEKHMLNKYEVSFQRILDMVNRSLVFGSEAAESVYLPHDAACNDFYEAINEHEVKAKIPYMKSCIWSALQKGTLDC